MITLGLPEYVAIALIFVLIGLVVGSRWVDRDRYDRVAPSLTSAFIFCGVPIALFLVMSAFDSSGIISGDRPFSDALSDGLIGLLFYFLFCGFPFLVGVLLRPQR